MSSEWQIMAQSTNKSSEAKKYDFVKRKVRGCAFKSVLFLRRHIDIVGCLSVCERHAIALPCMQARRHNTINIKHMYKCVWHIQTEKRKGKFRLPM